MNQSIKHCLAAALALALCAGGGLLCCFTIGAGDRAGGGAAVFFPLLVGFAAGAALLLLFTAQAFRDQTEPGLGCGALAVFFYLGSWLSVGAPSAVGDIRPLESILCAALSLVLLLLFLSTQGEGSPWVLWGMAILYLIVCGRDLVVPGVSVGGFSLSSLSLPAYTGLASLAAALICGWLWRKDSYFFRCLLLLSLVGGVGMLLWEFLGPGGALLPANRGGLDPDYLLDHILLLILGAAAAAALADFLRQEADWQREAQVRLAREQTIQAGYEQLLRHNEEVRMLRHDMRKHLYGLRQLAQTDETRLKQYLEDLTAAEGSIRPVIHSGSPLLNGILNGALSKAIDRGVDVKILRDQAPPVLPLSDMDLCTLVLNVMDNALNATTALGSQDPFIQLDLYTKGRFFFFVCANSANDGSRPAGDLSSGLGLSIIRQITERNGGLLKIDRAPQRYRISVALPTAPPRAEEA